MPVPLKVLLVESCPDYAQAIRAELVRAGFAPALHPIIDGLAFEKSLGLDPDIIIAPLRLDSFNVGQALDLIRDLDLDIPLIVIAEPVGFDEVVAALRQGAANLLLRDQLGRLGDAVLQALEARRQRQEKHKAVETLRQSKRQYEELVHSVEGVLWEYDVRAVRYTFVSKQAERLLGYPVAQWLDEPWIWEQCIHVEDRQWAPKYRDQAMLAKDDYQLEYRLRAADGHTVWVRDIVKIEREKEQPVRLRGMMIDISPRRHAEESLRQVAQLDTLRSEVGLALTGGNSLHDMLHRCAEAMVRSLDGAFARIWILNESDNVLELQASAGQYTHLDGPHSRVPVGAFKIGMIAKERRPHLTNDVPNDPHISDQKWAQREGMIAFAGYPLLIKDRLVGVMAVFARRPLMEAVLLAMASVADEIALGINHRRAEESLRGSEKSLREKEMQLRVILEQIPAILWTTDLNLLITSGIGTGLAILNLKPNQLVGMHLQEYLQTEDPTFPAIAAHLQALQGKSAAYELEWQGHSFQSHVEPLRGPDGGITGVIGVALDVTDRRKLENQFRQAQKMEAIGQLAGGIAHEFNNLLTIVRGYSELLLTRRVSEEGLRDSLEQILKAACRAADLTRQLLAYSRKLALVPRIVDLNNIVEDLRKMLQPALGVFIDMVALLEPNLAPVRVDPGLTEQVVMNLALNARDAMPQGGTLTIQTSNIELTETDARLRPEIQPGHYVMLTVADTGEGMDAETMGHLFEPFFSTKSLGQGTGLGLATSYGIIKQSGGYIYGSSTLGQGSTFKVYLPAVEELVDSPVPNPEDSKPLPRGSETILLVEDEDKVRCVISGLLNHQGYQVLTADSGQEALKLLQSHEGPIDLLLTDVMMREMKGPELAARIQGLWPGIQVLYMTGYADDAILRFGLSARPATLLSKPFSHADLARKVREVLDKAPQSRSMVRS